MTFVASPVNHWHEDALNGPALALTRMYWTYNAGTSTWTLTSERSMESGRFADLTGTSVFVLTPLGLISSVTPVLAMTRRPDGAVLSYRAA